MAREAAVVALLPPELLALVRAALRDVNAGSILDVASVDELGAELARQGTAVVVVAPEHGEALIAVLERHSAVGVVSYVALSPVALRWHAVLAKRCPCRSVIAHVDDEAERLRAIVLGVAGDARREADV